MKAYFLLLAVLVLSSFLVFRSLDEARAAAGDALPPVACPMIAKLCPDGSSVSPGGPNCEIPPCPGGGDGKIKGPPDAAGNAPPVACPMVAKLCPDGSSVSPKGPNCEIPACPGGGDGKIKPPATDDCDGDDCDEHKKSDEEND